MASASLEPAPQGALAPHDEDVSERIAQRCLALMLREFQRAPLPVLCADLFVACLAYELVGFFWPTLWFVAGGALQTYRFWLARSMRARPPKSASAAIRGLTAIFLSIGTSKALILPVFFFVPAQPQASAYLVTMVITGLAAGGVASVAGVVRALVAWGSPLFSVLIVAWLWRGGVAGIAVAALLGLLLTVLLAYVRDQRNMIEELIRLVVDKERLSGSLELERDRVQSVSEAKTRFFAAASHDLRQPLHALAINATTLSLLSERSNDVNLHDVSRGIDTALAQSQSLLDGLLDISKLDAHAVTAVLVPLDAGVLLRAICNEYAALAAQKGLRLGVDLRDDDIWVSSDLDQLKRILGNLVDNAIKFTKVGSVTCRARKDGGNVILEITDTGIGVPPGEREKVFEEFYQSGNPSRDRARGLGLGLAIVKRTCALLAIDIHLLSETGQGTTIRLVMESVPTPLNPGPPGVEPLRVRPVTASTAREYAALVIDDEEQVTESVARLLRSAGWTVETGSTAAHAEAAIGRGFIPDVLVVDYRLSEGNGLEVISRLRSKVPGLPAVIVTGDTAPHRIKALMEQANSVLHKPVCGDRLRSALIDAIDKGRGDDA